MNNTNEEVKRGDRILYSDFMGVLESKVYETSKFYMKVEGFLGSRDWVVKARLLEKLN